MADREALGRLVREIWVKCAAEQPDPKPSHLVPWEDLDEWNREVDMRIGETIAAAVRAEDDPSLPLVSEIRAWLLAHGWTPGGAGIAGTAWHPPHGGHPVGVPHGDDDPFVTAGAVERIAKCSGLTVGSLTLEMPRSHD